ncbi:DedA family protein [Minwuia thermotolerans]|uniref:DedA family protein n=2 Tax=Minwuia thermotolerans TaxID=2056226 RepID=A0A2M9FWG4_9PROT|nr:DedA family protein [Minwuia thermotolerans]
MFDWITGVIEQGGYPGIAFLMFAENVFPPIPSELIMPLAGFSAARGELDIVLATLAGSAGSLLGALFWYGIGRWLGEHERLKRFAEGHGRWLTLTPKEIDRARDWFERHGGKAVFLGRLVPAVRTFISVPAGVARMSLARVTLYSALGTVIWTALLSGAGFLLEDQYQRVAGWANPVSNAVVALLVIWYLYRVITFRKGG